MTDIDHTDRERAFVWALLRRNKLTIGELADGSARRLHFTGRRGEPLEVYRLRARAWVRARKWAVERVAQAAADAKTVGDAPGAEPAPAEAPGKKAAPRSRRKKAA